METVAFAPTPPSQVSSSTQILTTSLVSSETATKVCPVCHEHVKSLPRHYRWNPMCRENKPIHANEVPLLDAAGANEDTASDNEYTASDTRLLLFGNQFKGRLAADLNYLHYSKLMRPGHIDQICNMLQGWVSSIMDIVSISR